MVDQAVVEQMVRDAHASIEADLADYNAKPEDERKFYDIPVLVFKVTATLVDLADDVIDAAEEKKATVQAAVAVVWADDFAPLDIKFIPDIVEAVFDKYVVPAALSFVIEIAVGLKRKG